MKRTYIMISRLKFVVLVLAIIVLCVRLAVPLSGKDENRRAKFNEIWDQLGSQLYDRPSEGIVNHGNVALTSIIA